MDRDITMAIDTVPAMSSPATSVPVDESPAIGADRPVRRSPAELIARFVVAVPDRFLVLALCAILATAIVTVAAQLHPYTVYPVFVALAVAGWRLCPRIPPVSAAQLIGVVVAGLVTVIWIRLQWPYFSELLSVRRDPAIYTLRGEWLTDHPSPDLAFTPNQLSLIYATPGLGLDYGVETLRLTRYFQSTTVVPGLIAQGGWIGGASLLLKANILIGGGALMSVYAVGRRLAGPLLGLFPMVALAAGMPLAAFSRAPYTEPASLIAVMAALLGLWMAVREQRPALWLLAGAGAGAVAVTRIDGWLVVIGGVVGFAIWGGFAAGPAMRHRALVSLGWYSLAALLVGAIGFADLLLHSPDYLHVLADSSVPLLVAVPVSMVFAALFVAMPLGPVAGWLRSRSRSVAVLVTSLVGVAVLATFLRPLYYTAHHTAPGNYAVAVKTYQIREGLPIDPSRSYDEQSLTWLSWYQGWPVVVAGGLAALAVVWVAIRRRRIDLALVTAVTAVNAMYYLINVSITPDQIWAMRRFLPVILPGGLLLVSWLLGQAYRQREVIGRRLRPALGFRTWRIGTAVVLGAVATWFAVTPLGTWGSMFTIKEGAGQYDLVEQMCDRIGDDPVIIVGNIPVMGYYQPTLRNFCGSSVVTVPANTTAAQLAAVAQAWTPGVDETIKVVSFYPTGVPWNTSPPKAPVLSDTYQMWEATLSRRPERALKETTQVWLGTLRPDGRVDPVPAG